MSENSYIIVGQGIAGSALSFRMYEAGIQHRVIDAPVTSYSSSRVAAGIVNPVTGRKLVKSWMIDDLLPEVDNLYKGFEQLLAQRYLYELPVYKVLQTPKEVNDYQARQSDPAYEPYLDDVDTGPIAGMASFLGLGKIRQSRWVDTEKLINDYRNWLLAQNLLTEAIFDYDQLELTDPNQLNFGDEAIAGIVFCEGYRVSSNPFFRDLPVSMNKGEIMTIKADGLDHLDGIMNRNGFIIPMGSGKFKVGATFSWDDMDPEVTSTGIDKLQNKWDSLMKVSGTPVKTAAGFRPSCKDRRPLLGASTEHPKIYVFNGLGTKGVSLSAYFSAHLLDHMLHHTPLLDEVNIRRF